MRKKINPIILLVLIVSIFVIIYKYASSDSYVAKIDNVKITDQEYLNKLNLVITRMGMPDNGEVRRNLLRNMVDEKVFLVDGIRKGFDSDSIGHFKKEFFKQKVLLNMLLDSLVKQKVTVTDSELIEVYRRANTKVRAKYLLARSKEEADSLLKLLQNGASWDDLARNIFHDSHLKNSGGDLGYFTLDEMELPIEDAAYTLPLNKVSDPIPFSKGYAILKVVDRKGNPFLTETEFLKKKEKLMRFLVHRKKKVLLDSYVDSLIKSMDIRYNESVLNALYAYFNENVKSQPFREAILSIPDSIRNAKLATTKDGTFSVKDYLETARFNESYYANWIHSPDDFKQFVNGLIARKKLMNHPLADKIKHSDEYEKLVKENFENYIIDRNLEFYKSQIHIPQDTLFAYYSKNKDLFSEPDLYRFYTLTYTDSSLTPQIVKQIRKNYSLKKILNRFGKQNVKGGEAGYLTVGEFRKYFKRKDEPQTGRIYGPYKFKDQFVFFECTDRLKRKIPSFEEVKPQVERAVLYIKWDSYRKNIVDSLKKTMPLDVNFSKLRKLNRRLKQNG